MQLLQASAPYLFTMGLISSFIISYCATTAINNKKNAIQKINKKITTKTKLCPTKWGRLHGSNYIIIFSHKTILFGPNSFINLKVFHYTISYSFSRSSSVCL